MARRRRGRRSGFKIPVISAAILAGQALFAHSVSSNLAQTVDVFQSFYTGYNFGQGRFMPEALIAGYAPWLVKRFGMAVARPRLPIRGLPISLS